MRSCTRTHLDTDLYFILKRYGFVYILNKYNNSVCNESEPRERDCDVMAHGSMAYTQAHTYRIFCHSHIVYCESC